MRPIRPGFCLTLGESANYVGPHVSTCSRCHRRDRVHRCRPRAVRPAWQARASSGSPPPLPRAASARRRPSGPTAPSTRAEQLVEAPDVDVVHICTPNHLHVPLAAGRAGRRQARDLREADRARRRRRAGADATPPPARGRIAGVPFVYRYYPTVREARERVRTGVSGPIRLLHGSYLQDWLLRPEDDNWRVDAAARRRLARLRRHRLALVRPRRVRLRPPHHAALRAHADGAARSAWRARRTPPSRPPTATARRKRRHDRGRGARSSSRPTSGAVGTAVISQISAGRKNRLLPRARRRRGGAGLQPGGAGGAVGRPPRGGDADQARPRAPDAPRPPATRRCRPATRRATATASTRSSRRPTRRSRPARRPEGCRRSPTACAPPASPTPCWPRRARSAGSSSRAAVAEPA